MLQKSHGFFSCFSTGMDHLKPQYPIMKRNQYSLHLHTCAFSCMVDSISIMPHTCLFHQQDGFQDAFPQSSKKTTHYDYIATMCEYKYTHTYISLVIFSPPSASIYIKLKIYICKCTSISNYHVYISKIKKSYYYM